MSFIWKALEQHLFDSARSVLQDLLDQEQAPLYAAAFHASYREQEQMLSLPSLAANSQQALDDNYPDEQDQSFSSVKWNPADWRWDWHVDDYASAELLALDEPLQAFANRGRPRQWRSAERRFLVSIVRAARSLGEHFRGHPGVSADFVVIFHDFAGDVGLVKRSISPRQFDLLFPVERQIEATLRQVASLPEAEQATFYLSRLAHVDGVSCEVAETWLIAHGNTAQAGLIEQLQHYENATSAARILGLTGHAAPAVIDALRQHALTTRQSALRNWCAAALGHLHDHVWLIEQTSEIAVHGCCASFSSFRWRSARRPVLDYRVLEQLLEQRPDLHSEVQQCMDEQYGDMDHTTADVSEAIRGLGLTQVVIRRHAAQALNNRELDAAETRRAIQALQQALTDEDEQVRDLAQRALQALNAN